VRVCFPRRRSTDLIAERAQRVDARKPRAPNPEIRPPDLETAPIYLETGPAYLKTARSDRISRRAAPAANFPLQARHAAGRPGLSGDAAATVQDYLRQPRSGFAIFPGLGRRTTPAPPQSSA
jgi:hypothetical protein